MCRLVEQGVSGADGFQFVGSYQSSHPFGVVFGNLSSLALVACAHASGNLINIIAPPAPAGLLVDGRPSSALADGGCNYTLVCAIGVCSSAPLCKDCPPTDGFSGAWLEYECAC